MVHYAFAAIGIDYRITAGDPYIDSTNFIKLKAVKEKHPHLKILISVGGWGNSARFSDLALSAERRRVFAQSCVSFIKQYGFDGVDIDWEYPVSGGAAGRPEDKYNFTLMMKELRERLDEQAKRDGSYYYLSFAGGASSGYINNVQLGKLAGIVDYAVNMTYDLHGRGMTMQISTPRFYSGRELAPIQNQRRLLHEILAERRLPEKQAGHGNPLLRICLWRCRLVKQRAVPEVFGRQGIRI